MKKHFASLLFLLSSAALVSSPALSMSKDDCKDDFKDSFVRSKLSSSSDDSEEYSSDDSGSFSGDDTPVAVSPLDELEEFLSKQNYPRALRAMKKEGNKASDKEIVAFLLTSNGFTGWSMLSPEERASVVGRIAYEADRDELEEFLNKQNYPRALRSMRESGNTASNEEIVAFLLTSNGYAKWPVLSLDKRDWVVERITREEEVDHIRGFLSGQDFPRAFRSMKESGNTASDEEIAKYLIASNGYKRWESLEEDSRRMAFEHIIWGEDIKELQELLRARDFSSAFRSMREGNKASDGEIVEFLLTSNGYTKWDRLREDVKSAVVNSITGEDPVQSLYLFDDRVAFWKAYNLLKASKALPLDEGVVRLILEQRGFKFWDKLPLDICPVLVSYLVRGFVFPFPQADIQSVLDEERAVVARKLEKLTEGMAPRTLRGVIDVASQIEEKDIEPRVASIVKYMGVLLPPDVEEYERANRIEDLLGCDPALIEILAQNKSMFLPEGLSVWENRQKVKLLSGGDIQRVQAIVQHKDAFITPEMDSWDIVSVVETLMRGDAGQIKTAALGAKLMPSTSYGYLDFLALLLECDVARVQFVVQNANIFSADFDILAIFQQDMAKLQALVEAVKTLIPEDMDQYYRRGLKNAFVRSDAATLQILIKNKEVFFPEGVDPDNREYMTRLVMNAGVVRTQTLVQQKDVLFTDTMDKNTRSRIVFNILSSEVSADGIGLIGAVLTMHGATLFPVDLDNEDRAQIIEAAFRCDAVELDNRVTVIEAKAPVLLKDMKGRDYAEVLINALGVEAGEIGARAEAIRRNEIAYFTGIEKENVGRLTAVLLNADAPRIDGLAPSLKVLLQNIRDSESRVRGIGPLLKAEPDRVLALIKHKDMLLKDVSDWQLNRILETALKLSVEELDSRIHAITNLLLPGNLSARLLGRALDDLRRYDLPALLGKSVEEIEALEAAIGRNVPTFMSAHFAKSLVGTYDAYAILRNLIAVPANEIDSRGEGINHYANVLFPPEINDDANRAEIMAAVIKVKRDQLDKGIAKIAAVYATVDGKADSRARAQVIINNLPGRYY
ncbi:MAG: hypothetical protein JSR85_04170 [Proteobacteria bacterium]|nr:hypothetical protein [Pseudomonadota bacterium]